MREFVALRKTGNYKSVVDSISPDKASELSAKLSHTRIRVICLAIVLSIVVTSSARSVDIEFRYLKFNEGMILTDLAVVDSLPISLIEYINKGVPVAFEYGLEIWKTRRGWFDRHITDRKLTYRVRYDTWEKNYTVMQIKPDLTIEHILSDNREVVDLVTATRRVSIPLNDTSGTFYVVGKLSIKTMTLSNFKEVESWLKGEISGARKPELESASDDFGEFLFNTALRITGLQNISDEIKTEKFRIGDLPLRFDKPTE